MDKKEDIKKDTLGKGSLVVLDKEPPVGDNTTIMLYMVCNAAVGRHTPTAYFSPGMAETEVVNRLMATATGIDYRKIADGTLDKPEWKKLDAKLPDLIGAPLYIDDTRSIPLSALEGRMTALVRDHGVRIVVVDGAERVYVKGVFSEEWQRHAAVIAALERLAEELGIAVFAVDRKTTDGAQGANSSSERI